MVLPVFELELVVADVAAVAEVVAVESAFAAGLAIFADPASVAVRAVVVVAAAKSEAHWVAPEHREDSERTKQPLEAPQRSLIVVVAVVVVVVAELAASVD
jgi:hypothetical protein